MNVRNWFRSARTNRTITNAPNPTPKRTPRGLTLETLEDRTVPSAVAPPSGLVSWWTGDNTGADLMGLNNATLSNGTTYAAGKVAQAFSFDGVDDRADLGDPDSLKFTASMSIEGWIQVNALTTTTNFNAILFRGDSRGGLDPYDFRVNPNGTLYFGVSSLTSAASVVTPTPLPLGQLLHVAATLDDATGAMKLYVNGAVAAQIVTTVRPFRDLDPALNPGIGIGSATSTYNVPFNGLIDELSVYGRALSLSEVQAIYNGGGDGKLKAANYVAADFPTVAEGAAGSTTAVTFTIRRVGNLSGPVVVNWATADGTATAGSDYLAASGQVVFQDGESQKAVTVTVNGDNSPEADETFQLTLSTTPGYAVSAGWATIVDDDVGVSVEDSTATEGDGRIGQSVGAFVARTDNGHVDRTTGMAWGPDGNLYVGSLNTNQVLRFDGTTGALVGTFIDGVDSPAVQGLFFRPDGKLYVLSRNAAQVQRFDAATGTFLDVFISPGSGGLATPTGMTIGPDGNWYIASTGTNQILRYSGATGAFLGVFVAAGSGGLNNPRFPAFGPDGNLYVSNSAGGSGNTVLRFNGTTGAFMNTFVAAGSGGLLNPAQMLFSGGSLYVSSQNTNEVLRYDAANGTFLDKAATAGLGGLDHPIGLLLDSGNNLLVGSYGEILRYGPRSQAAFTVTLSIPSATPVTVNYAAASGSATAGADFTSVSGTLTFAPGQTTQTVIVPTLNDTSAEGTETFTLTLSNPSGATITRAQATGTITDEDTTKFYVADDGGTDRTYRYGAPGNSLANSTLNSGNAAPRGAASTAAGTTVWVVDANKTVYIYNNAGAMLGSWAAGGISGQPQIEGITTNGTDIWLVDAKTDKVFKYTGAASRLSGSQSAASNFSLNSANRDPKDLVTDGTSIWVVNDAASDKVFKYTVAGALLGSWTISTAGASTPTGITLDPSNPQHLWIVDSGTDKVYQYDSAVTRTSGSQAASTTFALAVGNTNPQGIADPPAPGTMLPLAIIPERVTNLLFQPDRAEAFPIDTRIHLDLNEFSTPGNQGEQGQKTLFTFTITLSAAYDQAVTMSFRTVNGTATTSDSDYVSKSGTLTFAPGETTKTITIEVKGDSKREANETFYLDLYGLSINGLFTKNRGLGTILNDD